MISETEISTLEFGKKLAYKLLKGTVLTLYGDLGAGKTTFAKGIISSLCGVAVDEIQSPTFTYVHSYKGKNCLIHHFDLYRLNTSEAFLEMGFLDYFESGGICIIEWPEKIGSLVPNDALCVELTHLENGKRRIDVRES